MIIDASISSNLPSFVSAIENLENSVYKIVSDITNETKKEVKANLDGKVLKQQTGNLYSSVDGNSFTVKDGYNYIGQVGAVGNSNRGFPYAAYWEGRVPQGNGKHSPWPRQYEQPAFDARKQKFIDKINEATKNNL
jgi:hypothetical protein